jgi:hypothetical protein
MYIVQDPSPGGSLQSPAYSPHCERAVLTPTDPLCMKAVQPGSMRSFQVQYLQIGLLFTLYCTDQCFASGFVDSGSGYRVLGLIRYQSGFGSGSRVLITKNKK